MRWGQGAGGTRGPPCALSPDTTKRGPQHRGPHSIWGGLCLQAYEDLGKLLLPGTSKSPFWEDPARAGVQPRRPAGQGAAALLCRSRVARDLGQDAERGAWVRGVECGCGCWQALGGGEAAHRLAREEALAWLQGGTADGGWPGAGGGDQPTQGLRPTVPYSHLELDPGGQAAEVGTACQGHGPVSWLVCVQRTGPRDRGCV